MGLQRHSMELERLRSKVLELELVLVLSSKVLELVRSNLRLLAGSRMLLGVP